MRQPLVAGNWKMHGSRAENASLVSGLLDLLQPGKRAEILLCPPFPYLMETGRLLKDSGVSLGAQSVCAESQGAFTGEVSAAMLKDVGCRYVLVGHSERRQLFGESDALVARKFVAAQGQGLVPVLCVGETLEEREGDQTAGVVSRQLEAVLAVSGVTVAGQGRHRLRTDLGHRHRPHGVAGPGPGSARDDSCQGGGTGWYNRRIGQDPVRRERQGFQRPGTVCDARYRRRTRRRGVAQGG